MHKIWIASEKNYVDANVILNKTDEFKRALLYDMLNSQHHHARCYLPYSGVVEFIMDNLDIISKLR